MMTMLFIAVDHVSESGANFQS